MKVINFNRFKLAKQGVFKNMPNPRNSDEVFLWRSVIDQTLHDLGANEIHIREEAEEWLDLVNEDFLEVCSMAEIDPLKVLDFVEKHRDILTNSDLNKAARRRKCEPVT